MLRRNAEILLSRATDDLQLFGIFDQSRSTCDSTLTVKPKPGVWWFRPLSQRFVFHFCFFREILAMSVKLFSLSRATFTTINQTVSDQWFPSSVWGLMGAVLRVCWCMSVVQATSGWRDPTFSDSCLRLKDFETHRLIHVNWVWDTSLHTRGFLFCGCVGIDFDITATNLWFWFYWNTFICSCFFFCWMPLQFDSAFSIVACAHACKSFSVVVGLDCNEVLSLHRHLCCASAWIWSALACVVLIREFEVCRLVWAFVSVPFSLVHFCVYLFCYQVWAFVSVLFSLIHFCVYLFCYQVWAFDSVQFTLICMCVFLRFTVEFWIQHDESFSQCWRVSCAYAYAWSTMWCSGSMWCLLFCLGDGLCSCMQRHGSEIFRSTAEVFLFLCLVCQCHIRSGLSVPHTFSVVSQRLTHTHMPDPRYFF